MNAASLLSDAGYPAADAAIAGAYGNSGGSQSNSSSEDAAQFGDVLAGVTASSAPPPQSDGTAPPWRASLAAKLPSIEQARANSLQPTSDGSTPSGRTWPPSASSSGAATTGNDAYSAALGKAAGSAATQSGSEDAAYSATAGEEHSIVISPPSPSSVASKQSAANAATPAAAAASTGPTAERGDTLALLRKIVGSQFATSADQESSTPLSPPSSSSDATGEGAAVAGPSAPTQGADPASPGSTAEAGSPLALFQQIIGARFATGNSPSTPPSATPAAKSASDPQSTNATQRSERERTSGRQSTDATSTASSAPPPAAAWPNSNPAAASMLAVGTVTPFHPAFDKTAANQPADLGAATGLSIGTGTVASPVTPLPSPSGGGTTEALPAEVSAALAQFNAKATTQETHLPPTLPLSPMHQIFNAVVSAASSLDAPAGSSAASPSDPTLPTAVAVIKTMTLALEPDELGKVEINMSLSNGQLNVAIGVDSGTTLRRLRDDQDMLTTSLESSGYDLHSVTIHGATGDLSDFSAQTQTGGGQGSSQPSTTNIQAGQSGSDFGQGRSGNDSFGGRNDNGSTGRRQDQTADQTAIRTADDGVYV